MYIPAKAKHDDFLIAQQGWWLKSKGDDGVVTYEAIVAWQRIENNSNLAGGALFPVTAGGAMCFAQFVDRVDIVFIPAEKMEWIGGTCYQLRKNKK